MAELNLRIVTPEKEIFEGKAAQVNVSTVEGILGILPNHAPLMAKIKPGELVIKNNGKENLMAIGGGFMQVADNTLTIMTDLAIEAENINEREVEEAKNRAQKAMEQKTTDEEYAAAVASFERSLAQLNVKRRHKAR